MARVVLNGREQEIEDGLSVAAFLAQEGEPAAHAIVEVNGEYVPLKEHPQRVLVDGDRVEVILPAFGG